MLKPLVDFFRAGTCLPDAPFCSPAVLKREVELAAQDLTPCERGGLCGKRVPDLSFAKRLELLGRTFRAVKDTDEGLLASLIQEAADAHHRYEERLGAPDPDWPLWYAKYLLGLEV